MPTVPIPSLVDKLALLFIKKCEEYPKAHKGRSPFGAARTQILNVVLETEAIRQPERKKAYKNAIWRRAPYLRFGSPPRPTEAETSTKQ
jgi:hypothetical protein